MGITTNLHKVRDCKSGSGAQRSLEVRLVYSEMPVLACTRFMTAILGSVRGGDVTSAATSRCIAIAAASAAACTSLSLDAAEQGADKRISLQGSSRLDICVMCSPSALHTYAMR